VAEQTTLRVAPSTSRELRSWTFAEMADDLPEIQTRFLVDQVLVEGQPLVIGGFQKTLKTSHLIDLAISLNAAVPFLGQFQVTEPRRVGLISSESGQGVIWNNVRRMAKAKGVNLRSLDGASYADQLPFIDTRNGLNTLRRFVETRCPEVLMIDPVYKAIENTGDVAGLFFWGKMLRELEEVCYGASVKTLILAHHSKAPSGPIPVLEDLQYAGLQQWARQWFLINRRQAFFPGSGLHHLMISVGGSAGHSSLWCSSVFEGKGMPLTKWDVSLTRLEDGEPIPKPSRVARPSRLTELKKSTLAALEQKYPEGATKKQLRDEIGANGVEMKRAVDAMMDEGVIANNGRLVVRTSAF
jgi:AAA domain